MGAWARGAIGPGPKGRAQDPGPNLDFGQFLMKFVDFMKIEKSRSEIPVIFPVVACLDLSYVSESRGFGFYQKHTFLRE